ncbi:MAG: UvrD-helicase domain-containing protein [Hungatella sp.]|nr:UvrD-helicase domain-containing protein [Hungatella sp.]
MAKFIGSTLQSDNWGEDYLIKKLMEYFDDSYVIYRNRPIFGTQFDVCLLAPKIGIIIFEVKAWKSDTIKEVKNGESIIIKTLDAETGDEGESIENPTLQDRGYVYKMRSKIRQKTGKTPLVYGMVCFPNLSKEDFNSKGIETVCEYESTILKEDMESKNAFYGKMNLGIKNHKGALSHCANFSPELMYRVRQIFETDLNIEDASVENTDMVKDTESPIKSAYSLFAYIPHADMNDDIRYSLAKAYSTGTKLYIITEEQEDIVSVAEAVKRVIAEKGLIDDGFDLKINFESKEKKKMPFAGTTFQVFNCSGYAITPLNAGVSYFVIKDGKHITEEQWGILDQVDKACDFNLEQYKVEHADAIKNIIVKAGAGTGKTFTMISRIAYICHFQNCAMKEMAKRIVMITFTDDAANQMEDRIKQHFNNYYLLTGDGDCLAFVNQIEGMQISTIHSYAKKLISVLGLELGYGNEVAVTSGDYKTKQIIADLVDKYISQKQKEYGDSYIKKLGMPVYLINKNILNILTRLHNQSIDVSQLESVNFGEMVSGGTDGEFHKLIQDIIPRVEIELNSYLKKQNKIHLNNMMSTLQLCIENKENIERLIKMQTGRPQYMFVDEFQDTDDIQIDAISQIARLLQYKLFVVGDVKQCIYRFRGAKENAFKQLVAEESQDWQTYSLYKNYRTDAQLLDTFHFTFSDLGRKTEGREPLLLYKEDGTGCNTDRLVGTKNYNTGVDRNDFYKKISINSEEARIPAVFEEVRRLVERIKSLEKQGKKLSEKDKEIAILVRENWQAESIKQVGKRMGFEVVTNTGGDLYMSAPALDMLILANALLHYDESDYLFAFVSSNFISGGMSKSRMFQIRENDKKTGWKKNKSQDTSQAKELQIMINRELSVAEGDQWKDWNNIIRALRVMPVLQVIRKIYSILKPWVNYGQDSKWKQDNYRLNVDMLFEELIKTINMDSLSINSLVDILTANIVSVKNVDSRLPDMKGEEYVIKCVTVHKSKGLEFGSVILPYCSTAINVMKRSDINVSVVNENGIKVGYQIKTDDDRYQNDYFDENMEKSERMREETRILYVAMTRAIRTFSWISLNGKNSECWQNLIWEDENNGL